MGAPWTEEGVRKLLTLHRQGYSASQTAALLPGGYTRNAIIGKWGRLGLGKPRGLVVKPAAPEPQPVASIQPPSVRVPRAKRIAPPEPVPVTPPPVALQAPPPAQVHAGPVRLMDLTAFTCRWPDGDPKNPDFHYCGARKEGDTAVPYCAKHQRLAYQPASAYRAANKRAMNRALLG